MYCCGDKKECIHLKMIVKFCYYHQRIWSSSFTWRMFNLCTCICLGSTHEIVQNEWRLIATCLCFIFLFSLHFNSKESKQMLWFRFNIFHVDCICLLSQGQTRALFHVWFMLRQMAIPHRINNNSVQKTSPNSKCCDLSVKIVVLGKKNSRYIYIFTSVLTNNW